MENHPDQPEPRKPAETPPPQPDPVPERPPETYPPSPNIDEPEKQLPEFPDLRDRPEITSQSGGQP
jgi:hypothetical protein